MNNAGYKQCKICPYFDKEKSSLHLEEGKTVNPMNKPFCKLAKNYVDETTTCEGLKEIETLKYELVCDNCKKTLAYFNVEIGQKGSKIGLMNFRYTPALMSYRPRKDKLLGLECICGHTDTRIGKEEYEVDKDNFPSFVEEITKNEAKFNEKNSTLKALLVKEEQ